MSIKNTILVALQNYKGDNLEMAELAFRGLSAEELQEPYGESGCTKQEILDGYRAHRVEVNNAIKWVKTHLEDT